MRSANIRRDGYLKFLNTWQNRDVIKVLSGVRRSENPPYWRCFNKT